MNSIPQSDQSPYILNVLAKLQESDLQDAAQANRIRVNAQQEAQKKIDELVQQSKSRREEQFAKMSAELLAECPEKTRQEALNQQIDNFKADMVLKEEKLKRERDDLNKMIFETLEEQHQNSANIVVQQYKDRGLSPLKFAELKNGPSQPIPQEFNYIPGNPDPEQKGMTARENGIWSKVLAPKESDGVQKVQLFVRLVDDETKCTLNAKLMGKNTERPYYLLEGIHTPPNVSAGGPSRVMAEFRDYLIKTGIEAVVAERESNLLLADFFTKNGFTISADGKELTYHGLLERPHRAEMLEALRELVKENVGIVSLGGKEHEGAVYEYFAVTLVDGLQSPTSGRMLLEHQEMFRIKTSPQGVEIKHQIESQFGNEVSALKINRKTLMADLQTATMLCAAEEGLGLESTWLPKIDPPSGLKGARFDRLKVNEAMTKDQVEPMGIAIMYPRQPNGYEQTELKTASLMICPIVPAAKETDGQVKETAKQEKSASNVIVKDASVPPPLPAKRRSALDEVDNPDTKDKKETKSKAKLKAKEIGTDV